MTKISKREWLAMLPVAAWGALLAFVPGAQFVVPLLGPPVAYLMLRKRPLLSWQIPVIAASVCLAMQDRDPNGPYTEGSVWPVFLLVWCVTSVLSVPWPYIFQRGMQTDRKKPESLARAAKMSLGAGVLIFLACGLILVGFALCFYPSASDASASFWDQWLGFLVATVGIALAVYLCLNASKLGLDFQIESLFGWILAGTGISFFFGILFDLAGYLFHRGAASNSARSDTPLQIYAASLEALAVVIWLLHRGKRMKRTKASPE